MKRKDVLLGLVILVVALAMLLTMKVTGKNDGNYARITVDGQVYGEYPLDEDREIEIEEDGYNRVCISGGEVYMDEADCPDGYCMEQGKISKIKQTIVCLPNKAVVEIISVDEDGDVDTIAK